VQAWAAKKELVKAVRQECVAVAQRALRRTGRTAQASGTRNLFPKREASTSANRAEPFARQPAAGTASVFRCRVCRSDACVVPFRRGSVRIANLVCKLVSYFLRQGFASSVEAVDLMTQDEALFVGLAQSSLFAR
jgi:hypothetical protein